VFQGLLYSSALPEEEFIAFAIARNDPPGTEKAERRLQA
jgi:sensor c-di-GMP phosphodiesterase-like protein